MKSFRWRPEVTPNKTKMFKHIYNYRSIIPQSLDVQIFIVSEISMWQAFCRGTGNGRQEMNFQKMKKSPRDMIIFYQSWKFQVNLSSHLWDILWTKTGKKIIIITRHLLQKQQKGLPFWYTCINLTVRHCFSYMQKKLIW